jgi:cob(I)alamin adenosyltransferase
MLAPPAQPPRRLTVPRLTKIYTRSGDRGQTGLVGGRRLSKDSPRIWAYGTVDELNSVIGLARSFNARRRSAPRRRLDRVLARIQNELFHLGAELATLPADRRPGTPRIRPDNITALEHLMDQLNAKLGPLREFILPGGSPTAAALHIARTVCRRAERFCVRLDRAEPLDGCVLAYLNRLGDALFVLARHANRLERARDTYWDKSA